MINTVAHGVLGRRPVPLGGTSAQIRKDLSVEEKVQTQLK